jgi:chitinase
MDAANSDASLGRQFYLTSAPQCPYPDVNNDAMLNGGVGFDAIFVQ